MSTTIKKVSMKDSKKTIGEFLAKTIKAVQKKDKNLFDRMKYTANAFDKDENSVTKSDLFELAEEVMTLLATPVAAEEVKPKSETALKKSGTAKSDKKEDTADKEEAPKKDTKKTEKKGEKTEKKDKQSVLNIREQVIGFPDKYERDGVQYEKAEDIKTIKDLLKAFENGEEFVFANVYTERMLVQMPYMHGLLPAPKKFEDDLDLAAALYVSDDCKVVYAVSTTTDGIYCYLPNELKYYDGVRFSNTVEYEIYRKVSGDEETEED